jgi:hypothetical protein
LIRRVRGRFQPQTARFQTRFGLRQSRPSMSMASCAEERVMELSGVASLGQTKPPSASGLV